MPEFSATKANIATHSTVGDAAASTTILAENLRRKGASIINTSSAILYLHMAGGTATATTAHHVQLVQGAYFEVPFGYTGAITGIWASDAGGSANVVEYT